MASFTIKSALFMLIITLLASFSNGFFGPLLKAGSVIVKGLKPKSTFNFKPTPLPKISPKKLNSPKSFPNVKLFIGNKGSEIPVEFTSNKVAERLAGNFFGPEGKRGFRWGSKLAKRYLVAEKRCQEYAEHLYPSCPRNQTNRLPQCAVHCIVELAANNDTCFGAYDSCIIRRRLMDFGAPVPSPQRSP